MIPLVRCVRRSTPVLALICAGVASAPARSQSAPASQASSPAHSAFGSIAGIVADSLHGGPLAGAEVSVEGLSSLVMTDSAGRFRIDSVPPGKYRIGIFHPLLDSLSLSIASAPVHVTADSALAVYLATPSALTFVRLACGPIVIDTLNGVGPSVIVGRVLDAETEAPAGNIHVSLSWTEIQAGRTIGLRRVRYVRDTTTGRGGEFRFCHVPGRINAVARAESTTRDSATVSRPFSMAGRYIGMLVLHMPGTDTSASHTPPSVASSGSSDGPPAGSVLTGRVMRSDGFGPLSGAQVTILGSKQTATTNDSGQFTLRGLPAGSRTLAVRALGWEPVTMAVDLAVHEPRQVTVPLEVKTAVLRAVIVTATLNAGLERVGFDARKRAGFGHYLGPDDIEKRNAYDFAGLMAGVPGVVRRPGPYGEDYLTSMRGTGSCVRYIVDGAGYQEMSPGDINTFVRPAEIGAVEVYQANDAPAQYAYSPPAMFNSTPAFGRVGAGISRAGGMGMPGGRSSATGCMKILIWTKTRLGL